MEFDDICPECHKKAMDEIARRQKIKCYGTSCSGNDERKMILIGQIIQREQREMRAKGLYRTGKRISKKFIEDDDARSNTSKLLEDAVTSIDEKLLLGS